MSHEGAGPVGDRGGPSLATAVDRNVAWLRTMLPEPDGSAGVWERLRLTPDGRDVAEAVYWVRPDCTAEVALLLLRAGERTGDDQLRGIGARLYEYLLGMGLDDGTFPFYRLTPPAGVPVIDNGIWDYRYPNDHGKLLELLVLLQDCEPRPEFDRVARGILDHFLAGQTADGWYGLAGRADPVPCYQSWATIGVIRMYQRTGDQELLRSATRAVDRLRSLQGADGRIRTSYELCGKEAWRPASSETAEALRCFALAQRILGLDLNPAITAAAGFLGRLTTPAGAIRNCDGSCPDASLQNDESLTDLVYTDGYALHAWLDAADATGDAVYLDRAERLAGFLAGIQCAGEDPRWDGAWRGSYDVDQGRWRGRADQQNPIDEGGELSVYTGWTNATISAGMSRLLDRRLMG